MGGIEIPDPPTNNCPTTTLAGGLSSTKCQLATADAGPPPKPRICEEGLTKCDGRLLQTCTDQGTAWVTLQACATPALCKSSDLGKIAECKPPTCGVEQMSCDDNVLRVCNDDRTGWLVFD